MKQRVTVVNPEQLALELAPKRKRTTSKRQRKPAKECITAMASRNKKGQFLPQGKKKTRRKRRKNPAPPAVVSYTPNARRKRRKNPALRSAVSQAFAGFLPRLAGKFAVAYAVRQFGGKWGEGVMGQKVTSPYAGEGWSLWNYLIAGLVGYFGGQIMERWRPGWGELFTTSVYDDILQRMVWTEVIGRSKTATEYLGNPDFVGWEDDAYGNRFAVLDRTNYQQAMLGVEAAGPLDGIEVASAIDGGRYRRAAAPMSKDPYQSAYL